MRKRCSLVPDRMIREENVSRKNARNRCNPFKDNSDASAVSEARSLIDDSTIVKEVMHHASI